MKKKKAGNPNGLGIGFIIFFAVVMFVRFYFLYPEKGFFDRALEGILSIVIAFLGSGVIYLALFIAVYFGIRIYRALCIQTEESENEDELFEHFKKLTDPLIILCFIASYIIVFLRM